MTLHAGVPLLSRNAAPPSMSAPIDPAGTNALTAMLHESPVKLAGAMPMTVNGCPLSAIVSPTRAGLPPNLRCQ